MTIKQSGADICMLTMDGTPEDVELTCYALIRINQTTPYDTRIFVLNNGGSNYLHEKLEGLDIWNMFLFRTEKNLGVAGGRNFLLDKAYLKHPGDRKYWINIDNDVYPAQDWYKYLIAPWEEDKGKPPIGMSAPVSNKAHGKQQIDRHILNFALPQPPGKMFDKTVEAWQNSQEGYWEPDPYIIGFCTCVSYEVMQTVGRFDEAFKLYGNEDADYFFRLIGAGYKGVISPRSVIYHYCNRGLDALGPIGAAQWSTNRRTFFKKHGFET